MEATKEHTRDGRPYEFENRSNATVAAKNLCQVYAENAISISQCYSKKKFQSWKLRVTVEKLAQDLK